MYLYVLYLRSSDRAAAFLQFCPQVYTQNSKCSILYQGDLLVIMCCNPSRHSSHILKFGQNRIRFLLRDGDHGGLTWRISQHFLNVKWQEKKGQVQDNRALAAILPFYHLTVTHCQTKNLLQVRMGVAQPCVISPQTIYSQTITHIIGSWTIHSQTSCTWHRKKEIQKNNQGHSFT
jgi:hypothetical protein